MRMGENSFLGLWPEEGEQVNKNNKPGLRCRPCARGSGSCTGGRDTSPWIPRLPFSRAPKDTKHCLYQVTLNICDSEQCGGSCAGCGI